MISKEDIDKAIKEATKPLLNKKPAEELTDFLTECYQRNLALQTLATAYREQKSTAFAALECAVYDAICHYPDGKERAFEGEAKEIYDSEFQLVVNALRQAGDGMFKMSTAPNNGVKE